MVTITLQSSRPLEVENIVLFRYPRVLWFDGPATASTDGGFYRRLMGAKLLQL